MPQGFRYLLEEESMQSVKVTMPRMSYVMILLMGGTGLVLALFTDPAFLANQDVSGFTSGRWAGVALGSLMMVWGMKGTLVPKRLFCCYRRGITIMGMPNVISWKHVELLEEAQIDVGFTQRQGRVRQERITHSAVLIRFDESVCLKHKGPRCSHAGSDGEHAYSFSTEVTGTPAGELINRIEQIRSRAPTTV